MQAGIRKIKKMAKAKPTMEGAGGHLHRAFGFQDTDSYDPFLLLDDFRGDNPEDYLAGFPWHPHRGIETITYMLAGSVEHGDSLGNSGIIKAGGVQWMTAGAGDQGARFLLVSGLPLREPVAWYGPIVMNTRHQLKQAFTELEQGTFLQHNPAGPTDGPEGQPGQES